MSDKTQSSDFTGLEYGILGLLADGNKTGYDILATFKASASLHWRSTAGSVYPALGRLEQRGLVSKEVIAQNKRPNRKVFSLTEQGRNVFLNWLSVEVASYDPRDAHHLLLKLAFSHHLSRQKTIALVEGYHDRVAGELKRLEELVAKRQGEMETGQYLALTNTVTTLRSQVTWAKETSIRLRETPEFRPAQESDMPCVLGYLLKYRLDDEDIDHSQFLVAEAQGSIVGFVRMKPHKERFELASLGVLESHRKRGIGSALVRKLIRELPGEEVWAITDVPEFFKRFGFERAEKVPEEIQGKIESQCQLKGHPNAVAMILRKELQKTLCC